MHDHRNALLARTIRPGDQHRHIRTGHLASQIQRTRHGLGGEDQPIQVVFALQRVAALAALLARPVHFAGGLGQFQQVLDRSQQLGVIPRLGQVIGRPCLHQLHRRFQVRPGREQDQRQVGMALPDGPEQVHTLFAGGGVGREIHVLDHDVYRLALQHFKAVLGRQRDQWPDVVQRKQQRQRLAHGRVVVNDQYGAHSFSTHAGMDAAPAQKVAMMTAPRI